jgi:hypothetical protein
LSPGKGVADIDRKPVLAAIGRPGDGEIIDHLREGERDHDEIDARGAQAERADQQRREAADEHRDQPQHQHLVGAVDQERRGHQRFVGLVMAGENAHGIAAETEEGGMAEGHQASEPQRDVEADAGQRQDGGAGGERDQERLVGEMRDQRSASRISARTMLRRCSVMSSGIGGKQPLWLEHQHHRHQR